MLDFGIELIVRRLCLNRIPKLHISQLIYHTDNQYRCNLYVVSIDFLRILQEFSHTNQSMKYSYTLYIHSDATITSFNYSLNIIQTLFVSENIARNLLETKFQMMDEIDTIS